MINKKDFDLLVTFKRRGNNVPTFTKTVTTQKMTLYIPHQGGTFEITKNTCLCFDPTVDNNTLTTFNRVFKGLNVNKIFCNRVNLFKLNHRS